MTDAMLDVLKDFDKEMERECLYCQGRLRAANIASNIKLPHMNERGDLVPFGAKREMMAIADYWYQRLQFASRYVSREFEHDNQLFNKRVGIDDE